MLRRRLPRNNRIYRSGPLAERSTFIDLVYPAKMEAIHNLAKTIISALVEKQKFRDSPTSRPAIVIAARRLCGRTYQADSSHIGRISEKYQEANAGSVRIRPPGNDNARSAPGARPPLICQATAGRSCTEPSICRGRNERSGAVRRVYTRKRGILMLWRRYWPGRRARPSASLGRPKPAPQRTTARRQRAAVPLPPGGSP